MAQPRDYIELRARSAFSFLEACSSPEDLVEVAAYRFQDSLEADAKAGNENASNAYRNAATTWRAYRDAECARRGPGGSDAWRGCMVDLTRRRYLDLQ